MKLTLAMVVVLALAGAAWAGAVKDVSAGIRAKSEGQYEKAIALLTKGLDAPGVNNEQRVAALLNRGACWESKERPSARPGRLSPRRWR